MSLAARLVTQERLFRRDFRGRDWFKTLWCRDTLFALLMSKNWHRDAKLCDCPRHLSCRDSLAHPNLLSHPEGDEVVPVSGARQVGAPGTNAIAFGGALGCGCAALRMKRRVAHQCHQKPNMQ